jgi:hypothetical protein
VSEYRYSKVRISVATAAPLPGEAGFSILQEFLQRRCLQPLCDRYCVIGFFVFLAMFLMWLDKDINPSIEKYLLRQ